MTFEASPSYLLASASAKRIFEYDPKIKLIALFREPVERAFSCWNMYKKFYRRNKDWFDEELKRYDKKYDGTKFFGMPMARRNLARFDSFDHVVREELSALGQGKTVESPVIIWGHYCDQLKNFFEYFAREQLMIIESQRLKTETTAVLKEVEAHVGCAPHDWTKESFPLVLKGEYKDAISEETRDILRVYYEPFNKKLFKLLGHEFNW